LNIEKKKHSRGNLKCFQRKRQNPIKHYHKPKYKATNIEYRQRQLKKLEQKTRVNQGTKERIALRKSKCECERTKSNQVSSTEKRKQI
jgi:hypothetical protein